MSHTSLVIAFFALCALVFIAIANSGPTQWEIAATARKDAAVALATRGASPFVVACILNPPTFFTSECNTALREAK